MPLRTKRVRSLEAGSQPHGAGRRANFPVRVCAGEAGGHAGASSAGRTGLFPNKRCVREEAARPNPKARRRRKRPVATTVLYREAKAAPGYQCYSLYVSENATACIGYRRRQPGEGHGRKSDAREWPLESRRREIRPSGSMRGGVRRSLALRLSTRRLRLLYLGQGTPRRQLAPAQVGHRQRESPGRHFAANERGRVGLRAAADHLRVGPVLVRQEQAVAMRVA